MTAIDRRHASAAHAGAPNAASAEESWLEPQNADAQPRSTTDSWVSAVSGTWSTGSKWSTGAAPTTSNDALIAVAGKYTVTIAAPSVANSLTITDSMATVDDTGTLTVGTTLAVTAGTFILEYGSTVKGATISTGAAGKFLSQGGTLSGATYQGTLDLSGTNAGLSIANGFALTGTGGTGKGTINLTTNSGALFVTDTETLANGVLNVGGSNNYIYIGTSGNATLTLGPSFSIVHAATSSSDYISPYASTATLINQGTITASAAGGYFSVTGNIPQFTNAGQIAISNGDYFTTNGVASFTNSGTISVTGTATYATFYGDAFTNSGVITDSAGGNYYANTSFEGTSAFTNTGTINVTTATNANVGAASALWSNQGVIEATNGGQISLVGTYSLATFNSVTDVNSYLDIAGQLNNTGTLTVPGTLIGGLDQLSLGSPLGYGTISGGTVRDTAGALYCQGGTLSGVTYQGTLALSQTYETVTVVNGLTLAGAGGTGTGTINITGQSDTLYINDSETLTNGTLNLNGSNYDIYLSAVGDTLTIGASFSLLQSVAGSYGFIDSLFGDGTLINQGTISAAAANAYIGFVSFAQFTNTGQIAVSNGGDFQNSSGVAFTNSGTITATGTSSYVYLYGATFTNSGLITDAAGGYGSTSTIEGSSSFTNTGTINITGANNAYVGAAGALWTNQGVIEATSGGQIDLVGTYSLATFNTVSDVNSYLDIAGQLNNTGTLIVPSTLVAGLNQLTLGAPQGYGIISGGVVRDATGALYFQSGTLSGVTYQGTLALSQFNEEVYIANGITLTGAAGTGAGTINLTGQSDFLYFNDSETLTNGVLNFGGNNNYLYLTQSSATLTIGASFSFVQSVANSSDVINTYSGNGSLFNQGTIALSAANGYLSFSGLSNFTNIGQIAVSNGDALGVANGSSFTNTGTITASGTASEISITGGGAFTNSGVITDSAGSYSYLGSFEGGTAFTNTGTINITGGATAYVGATSALWINQGVIEATNGAQIDLAGTYSLATFNSVSDVNSYLDIVGQLNNTGTLIVPSALVGGYNQLYLGSPGGFGSISGGVVSDATGALYLNGGSLSGVTYQGPLNLSQDYESVHIVNGITLAGANGTGAGTINLSATEDNLYIDDSETLTNSVLNFNGNANYLYIGYLNTTTLTTGSTFSIVQSTASAYDYIGSYYGNSTLINQGTIAASASGGYFNIQSLSKFTNAGQLAASNGDNLQINVGTSFTNTGSMVVSTGGTIDLGGSTISNLKTGTLTGGVFEVDAGSTLKIANNTTIGTLAATVILSGANSVLESYNTSTGKYVTIDQKLTTIAAGGSLELLTARGFATAGAFADNGLLLVAGGTFSTAGLTIATTGIARGFGTLSTSVTDNGLIEASGGKLAVTGAITGIGTLQIDAGATLELVTSTTSAETATFAGQGTLKLDAAASFASPIANYQGGDVLNIGTLVATAAAITGSTLAITVSGGTPLTETLTGSFANERAGISADGHSITAYREAAANTLAPAALGKIHVGGTVSATLSLTNTVPADGFSEALDATIAASGTGITASGSVSLLAAGETDSTDLKITATSGTDGAITGSATITLSSDGTGIDGQSAIGIGSQTIAVTGAAYNYAAGTLATTTINFGDHHIGDAANAGLTLTNTAPADGYAEALDASFAPGATGVSASGTITGLAAGATNSTTLQLALNTTTAGAVTGGATLGLISDGNGIDGLGTTTLASQAIGTSGAVFAFAAGTLASSTINLGIYHVGDVASRALTLTNSGPATGGYTEALDGTLGGATTGITATGSVTLLGVGASNSTALLLGLNTAKVGTISGTATLGLVSDGTGLDSLGKTSLAGQTVNVTGTIDNYAKLQLFQVVGTTGVGIANHATINLGTTTVGAKALSVTLGVDNYVAGPSDVLSGSFTETGSGFTNKGFTPFSNLGSMQYEHSQSVTLATTTAGVFTETIQVSGTGSNASGYSGALATQTITITGTIAAVGTAISAPGATPSGSISFLLGTQPTGTAVPISAADLAATPAPSEFVPALGSTTPPPSATASAWAPTTPVFADLLDTGLSAAHPPAPDYVSHPSAIV